GNSDPVDVIEIAVQVGDVVAQEDTLVVVESDKATVEIPAPRAGTITAIKVELGSQIRTDDPLVEMAAEGEDAQHGPAAAAPAAKQASAEPTPAVAEEEISLVVPELGDIDGAVLIEWLVQEGDHIEVDDLVAVLESDKASFEVPAEQAGKVVAFTAELGQSVN